MNNEQKATQETVTISADEYKSLLMDSAHLEALHNSGVDNWEHYFGNTTTCDTCETSITWDEVYDYKSYPEGPLCMQCFRDRIPPEKVPVTETPTTKKLITVKTDIILGKPNSNGDYYNPKTLKDFIENKFDNVVNKFVSFNGTKIDHKMLTVESMDTPSTDYTNLIGHIERAYIDPIELNIVLDLDISDGVFVDKLDEYLNKNPNYGFGIRGICGLRGDRPELYIETLTSINLNYFTNEELKAIKFENGE